MWDGEKKEVLEITTRFGKVTVVRHGNPKLDAFVTYHDVGLNGEICFNPLFSQLFPLLRTQFCVYHVNAPGHANHSDDIPKPYFSMEDLSFQLEDVLSHLSPFRSVVLWGAGVGGHIMLRFLARQKVNKNSQNQEMNVQLPIRGVVLAACHHETENYLNYYWNNFNVLQASWLGMTSPLQETLLQHYFGSRTLELNYDLVHQYRLIIQEANTEAVCGLLSSYYQREDSTEKFQSIGSDFRTIIFNGKDSYMMHAVRTFKTFLPASETSYLEFQDCGALVHLERPDLLLTPLKLFLQGLSYF
eukprot:Lithocolla_globosa_v1_NODE_7245_length_972_cov_13.895311.p1 type:complete len:301 gc:universal NODE_7245_length_972_cov_13.895311:56-958(+)